MGNSFCYCSSKDQYFSVFNEFFEGMKIRNKTALFYNEKIVENWDKSKVKSSDELEEFLFQEFFNTTSHPNLSRSFIKSTLEKYKSFLSELMISLVFFTQQDKGSFKISFKKLLKHYKSDSIKSDNSSYSTKYSSNDNSLFNSNNSSFPKEKRYLYIKKVEMFDVLKVYVNMVTLGPVPFLASLSKNPEDFVQMMNEEFNEESQVEFINKKLEKYGNDKLCVDEFIDQEYFSISEHNSIRIGVSMVKSQKELSLKAKKSSPSY